MIHWTSYLMSQGAFYSVSYRVIYSHVPWGLFTPVSHGGILPHVPREGPYSWPPRSDSA